MMNGVAQALLRDYLLILMKESENVSFGRNQSYVYKIVSLTAIGQRLSPGIGL